MHEDGHQCWRVRQGLSVAIAEDHRLHAAEDGGECDAERDQEEWSGPGMFAHGGGEDEEFAGEDAEGRHAEDREGAENESPADGRAGAEQAADAVHLLRAGLLRGMPRGEEDGGYCEGMHGHVQQRRKVGDRAAESEGEGDDAHMLNGGVSEEAFYVALAPEEERGEYRSEEHT